MRVEFVKNVSECVIFIQYHDFIFIQKNDYNMKLFTHQWWMWYNWVYVVLFLIILITWRKDSEKSYYVFSVDNSHYNILSIYICKTRTTLKLPTLMNFLLQHQSIHFSSHPRAAFVVAFCSVCQGFLFSDVFSIF